MAWGVLSRSPSESDTLVMLTTRTRPLSDDILQVLVEENGEVVGRCHLFTAVHWDEWWIDERGRGKGAVLKALIARSLEVLKQGGIDTVYTGVEDDRADIRELLAHFGFKPAPGRLFLLKVDEAALQLKTEGE